VQLHLAQNVNIRNRASPARPFKPHTDHASLCIVLLILVAPRLDSLVFRPPPFYLVDVEHGCKINLGGNLETRLVLVAPWIGYTACDNARLYCNWHWGSGTELEHVDGRSCPHMVPGQDMGFIL